MNYDSIADFRNQMKKIDEDYFFRTYENYIGKVETPYHKPFLENELVSFFQNPSNQQLILSLIDRVEAAICFFIFNLDRICTAKEIEAYFSITLSSRSVQGTIENLKQRFILIENSSTCELQINAILQTRIIEEKGSLYDMLDYGFPEVVGISSLARCDTGFHIGSSEVLAVASIMTKGSYSSPSAIVKHIAKIKTFQALDQDVSNIILENISHILWDISILRVSIKGSRSTERIITEKKLHDLLQWSPLQLAIFISCNGNAELCSIANQAIELLSKFAGLKASQMSALLNFLSIREGLDCPFMPWSIVHHLSICNVLRIDEDGHICSNAEVLDWKRQKRSGFIASNTTEFNFYGEPDGDDASLAFLAEAKQCDRVQTYCISYEGFKLMQELCDSPSALLSQFSQEPLKATLGRYQSEMERFSINEGYLIESNDPLLSNTLSSLEQIQPYIIKSIPPSIFLLSRKDQDKWIAILRQFIDIDIRLSNNDFDRPACNEGFGFCTLKKAPSICQGNQKPEFNAEERQREIRKQIIETEAFKPELFAAIDSKLILSQKQFSRYLTAEAMTSSRSSPNETANVKKLKASIQTKAQRIMIKTGGKTLIVMPSMIGTDKRGNIYFEYKEFPSMTVNSVLVKTIQAITVF